MLKQVNQTYHTLKIHYYIREIDFISPVELNVPYKLCKSKRICDIIKTGNKKMAILLQASYIIYTA